MARDDYELFDLGDYGLVSGMTLRSAKLAYKTYGTLSERRDNAILYPTWYSGRHWENEWLIGDGMALDPKRYFVIVRTCSATGCHRRRATRRRRSTAPATRTSR